MYSNITKEMASRIGHRGTNRLNSTQNKSLNDKLLQAVTRVRSLEDQLLAEQYRQQLLLDQNDEYKQQFQRLRNNNELQQQRISRLQSQMNLHQVKNGELQTCENSLRAIYTEINELTRTAKIRDDECQLLMEQRHKLQEENRTMRERNYEMESRQTIRNETIVSYLKNLLSYEQCEQMNPLSALQAHYLSLKDSLYSLKNEQTRIRRELSNSASIEKQLLIKLQYEQQLLTQRGQDLNKIEELTKICQNQQNLQAVVQDMLEKQDELVAELDQRREENKSLKDQYEGRRYKLRRQWEEELQMYTRQIREAKRTKQQWESEIALCDSRLLIVTEQYQTIIDIQAQSMRMDVNLTSMRQLREVEERNKHLKLQINEMQQMRNLLQQEKEILHPEL